MVVGIQECPLRVTRVRRNHMYPAGVRQPFTATEVRCGVSDGPLWRQNRTFKRCVQALGSPSLAQHFRDLVAAAGLRQVERALPLAAVHLLEHGQIALGQGVDHVGALAVGARGGLGGLGAFEAEDRPAVG